jgi:hypothetical protein
MRKVEEIYQGTVLPLPPEERLQLASLIPSGLTGQEKQEKLSAVELIGSFSGGRDFRSAEDADAYLREERDSWEP